MELRALNLSMDENLATNLMYGAAVCRLCYYRKPDALPKASDPLKDAKKAQFYLDCLIEKLEQ